MSFDAKDIFSPSAEVCLIFDIDSSSSHSTISIIYDIDTSKNIITIAQPIQNLSKKSFFDKLHITKLIYQSFKKIRVGLKCIPVKFIDEYKLKDGNIVPAVLLKYRLPITQVNIRTAFRLPLGKQHSTKGKILYNDCEYYLSKDFSIRNISSQGLGFLAPKIKNTKLSPLAKIKLNEHITIGIILMDANEDKLFGAIPLKCEIIRINYNYSKKYIFIGVKFIRLKKKYEKILNKFVHNAQINELKKIKALNS